MVRWWITQIGEIKIVNGLRQTSHSGKFENPTIFFQRPKKIKFQTDTQSGLGRSKNQRWGGGNVILKFLYLSCYDVSITDQFYWQASEAQCFDCEKICACARQFQTSIFIIIPSCTCFTYSSCTTSFAWELFD